MRMSSARPLAKLLRPVTIAAIACCVVASSVSPASASSAVDTSDPADVAALVAKAAPDEARPVDTAATDGAFQTSVAGADASIPVDPKSPIEISTNVGGRELSASISLPDGLSLAAGAAAADGTVVFASENDATVAVQTLESGDTRIQTVIPHEGARHDAEFGMDGFRAIIDSSGNAGFIEDGRAGAFIPVDAPWATDARGAAVSTYYEVRGDKLAQVVVPAASTAYPIVADPTWGWRNAAWGVTLSRSETANIKDYTGASAFCAALVRNQRLTLACGLWSGYLQVQAATANNLRPKGCLHIVVAPLPGAISHTSC